VTGAAVIGSQPPTVIVAGKAPARLTIELPADAKLFVDGQLIAGSGPSRQFHTPELPAGQAFYYELKAEVIVNGKASIEEAKVVVKAGEVSTAKFEKLVAAAAPRELASK